MKGMGRVLSIGATLVLVLSLATAVYAHKAASTGNAVPTTGTTYALVVGISDYYPCGTGGPDLSYADDDADAFEGALNTVYGILLTKITKLKDCSESNAATKTDIQNWFTDAASPSGNFTSTSNDDIIFYASGHGTRAFCPNGKVGNAILVNTGTGLGTICEDELRGWLDAITAARKVVILDISFPSQFRNSFRNAANTLLITAARGEAREAAFTDPTHTCYPGRGIFTCWFVEKGILDGEANNASLNPHTYNDPDVSGNEIPFEEAYDYVFHNVPPIQKPGIMDNVSDDFLPTD